jgi:hypothetical protein
MGVIIGKGSGVYFGGGIRGLRGTAVGGGVDGSGPEGDLSEANVARGTILGALRRKAVLQRITRGISIPGEGGMRFLLSRVPECEGPGAPYSVVGLLTGGRAAPQ